MWCAYEACPPRREGVASRLHCEVTDFCGNGKTIVEKEFLIVYFALSEYTHHFHPDIAIPYTSALISCKISR